MDEPPEMVAGTTGDAWVCETVEGSDSIETPVCDPDFLGASLSLPGSGATWCVDLQRGSSVTVEDGQYSLTLAWAGGDDQTQDCQSAEIFILSDPHVAVVSGFPLSPVYELRISPETRCDHFSEDLIEAAIEIPPSAVGACGIDGPIIEAIWPTPGNTQRVVATRPCPKDPICDYACRDVAHDEQHCGACNVVCPALCQGGDCLGETIAGRPNGPLATDGSSVYWIEADDDGGEGEVRRLSLTAGAPSVEVVGAAPKIVGLDARQGQVAWVELTQDGSVLRHRHAEVDHVVPLPVEYEPSMKIRILEDATVLASAAHDPPVWAVFPQTGTVTPLSGCFGSGAHPIVVDELGRDGGHVVVAGEDEDPDDTPYDLWHCAADGSSVAELVDDGNYLNQIDGQIYWRDSDEVYRVEDGVLTPVEAPWAKRARVRLDGDTVYAADSDNIVRFRDDGWESVISGVSVSDFVVAGGQIVLHESDRPETIVVVPLP